MIRFFVVFIAVLAILFRIDMLDSVQTSFVHPWTNFLATVSAAILTPFDTDIAHHGRILMSKSTGFAVSIEAGCNGVEAAIILIAGMLAFPSSAIQKVVGIVVGIVAVQAVNLLRIISLYYLGKWNTAVFEFSHLYLWQALIMIDVLVVWLLWIRWASKRKADQGLADAA